MDTAHCELSVLVLTDAFKRNKSGEHGVFTGHSVGRSAGNSMFHPISGVSYESKRPAKSVFVAEILSSAETADKARCVAYAYSKILDFDVSIHLCGLLRSFLHLYLLNKT